MTGRPIHIALTFDDNFWAPAYATMRSICLFSQRREDLVFHLCHLPLSEDHRADLAAIAEEFPVTLRWHDLDGHEGFRQVTARAPQSARLPRIVYARLLIDQFLEPGIERLLYLDCDMLVRDDVAHLFELDLEGFPLAAVRDPIGAWLVAGRDVRENRDIFDVSNPYFNSGLLLIDVEKWRDADIPAWLLEADRRDVLGRLYYDQDVLNLVFRNNWLALPWRWNVTDVRPVHEGLNPAILHYTGEAKPWGILMGIKRSVAYARFYRHVMTNALFHKFYRHRVRRWWKKTFRLA